MTCWCACLANLLHNAKLSGSHVVGRLLLQFPEAVALAEAEAAALAEKEAAEAAALAEAEEKEAAALAEAEEKEAAALAEAEAAALAEAEEKEAAALAEAEAAALAEAEAAALAEKEAAEAAALAEEQRVAAAKAAEGRCKKKSASWFCQHIVFPGRNFCFQHLTDKAKTGLRHKYQNSQLTVEQMEAVDTHWPRRTEYVVASRITLWHVCIIDQLGPTA
jgi:nucleoid-associated protein YgaU